MSEEQIKETAGRWAWRVDVSFYVPIEEAATADAAETLVHRELNSKVNYWRELIGDADIHEGETVAWDMEG